MGEQLEETLAVMSHFKWSPCCFLALLSLMVKDVLPPFSVYCPAQRLQVAL